MVATRQLELHENPGKHHCVQFPAPHTRNLAFDHFYVDLALSHTGLAERGHLPIGYVENDV